MKNGITELVFILDRSSSMSGLEEDTIGGFNSLLEKQKRQEGACFVSTLLFDHVTQVLHDRLPLERVPPMTRADYIVQGSTALLDAVGGAIHHIGNIHKYARAEDVPEHTLFVITTDGMENASRQYGAQQVKDMLRRQEETCGWEFLFLGANIDAVQTAGSLGIRPSRAVDYHADSQGVGVVFTAVEDTVRLFRHGAPIAPDWSRDIQADHKGRKKDSPGAVGGPAQANP